MNILLLNLSYAPHSRTGSDLLARFDNLTAWADHLRRLGAHVAVCQRFHRDERLERDHVLYQFVADRWGPELRSWQFPGRVGGCLAGMMDRRKGAPPGVVHLNGLRFPAAARKVRAILPPAWVLVLQHQGEPPRAGLRWPVHRWGCRAADGYLFTAAELAEPWRRLGLLPRCRPVFEVLEGSSLLQPRERTAARSLTGMSGSPVILWTGNLDANEDPLTVLAGFRDLRAHCPGARLYMAWRHDPLLSRVRAEIAAQPALRDAVTLLGSRPRPEMEPVYNSADYFVQASHRDGGGFALLDAMACGVVPVVTDLPSVRVMTNRGDIGALWPPGDADAFRRALLDVLRRPLPAEAARAQDCFRSRFSYPMIAARALEIYAGLSAKKAPPTGIPLPKRRH